MEEVTSIAFQIISIAGEAKGIAYDALEAAKEKDFDKAKALLDESQKKLNEAHTIQFQLLSNEASGAENLKINFIMAHAQDHLMTTMTAIEWITENIELREEFYSCTK